MGIALRGTLANGHSWCRGGDDNKIGGTQWQKLKNASKILGGAGGGGIIQRIVCCEYPTRNSRFQFEIFSFVISTSAWRNALINFETVTNRLWMEVARESETTTTLIRRGGGERGEERFNRFIAVSSSSSC